MATKTAKIVGGLVGLGLLGIIGTAIQKSYTVEVGEPCPYYIDEETGRPKIGFDGKPIMSPYEVREKYKIAGPKEPPIIYDRKEFFNILGHKIKLAHYRQVLNERTGEVFSGKLDRDGNIHAKDGRVYSMKMTLDLYWQECAIKAKAKND
jgi:hypothetical protein